MNYIQILVTIQEGRSSSLSLIAHYLSADDNYPRTELRIKLKKKGAKASQAFCLKSGDSSAISYQS